MKSITSSGHDLYNVFARCFIGWKSNAYRHKFNFSSCLTTYQYSVVWKTFDSVKPLYFWLQICLPTSSRHRNSSGVFGRRLACLMGHFITLHMSNNVALRNRSFLMSKSGCWDVEKTI